MSYNFVVHMYDKVVVHVYDKIFVVHVYGKVVVHVYDKVVVERPSYTNSHIPNYYV